MKVEVTVTNEVFRGVHRRYFSSIEQSQRGTKCENRKNYYRNKGDSLSGVREQTPSRRSLDIYCSVIIHARIRELGFNFDFVVSTAFYHEIVLTKKLSLNGNLSSRRQFMSRKRQLLSQNGNFCPNDKKLPKPHTNYLSRGFLVFGYTCSFPYKISQNSLR